MAKELLEQETWFYTLERDGTQYTLDVICGSVGLFNRVITLTSEEVQQYEMRGKPFITELAQRISDQAVSHPN